MPPPPPPRPVPRSSKSLDLRRPSISMLPPFLALARPTPAVYGSSSRSLALQKPLRSYRPQASRRRATVARGCHQGLPPRCRLLRRTRDQDSDPLVTDLPSRQSPSDGGFDRS